MVKASYDSSAGNSGGLVYGPNSGSSYNEYIKREGGKKEMALTAKKQKIIVLSIIGGCCLWIVCIFAKNIFQKKYDERMLTVITAISDVTVHEKWIDGEMYATISTSKEMPTPLDYYFFEPVTVRLASDEIYDDIDIKSEPYASAMLKIAIPYNVAAELGVLNFDNGVSVELLLKNKEYIQRFCIIENLRRESYEAKD